MNALKEQGISNNKKIWLIPLLCLLTGGALIGISTNLAKYAGEIGLSPLAFLFWSITGGAFILSTYAFLRHELPPLSKPTLKYYLIAALVSVAGSNLIFFSAVPHVGASFVALTVSLPPLLTYLAAIILRIEPFTKLRAFGVVAALAGVGVLAARKFSAPDASIFWIVLTLCGPVLLAIGNIYRTLYWPNNLSPSALAPGMLIAASVLLALVSIVPHYSLAVPTTELLPIGLIAIQAFVFAAQFLLLFLLQKTGGPVLLSLLGAVGALVGVPVAIFLQGESPPEGLFMGASLIALGVILVTYGGIKMTIAVEKK